MKNIEKRVWEMNKQCVLLKKNKNAATSGEKICSILVGKPVHGCHQKPDRKVKNAQIIVHGGSANFERRPQPFRS